MLFSMTTCKQNSDGGPSTTLNRKPALAKEPEQSHWQPLLELFVSRRAGCLTKDTLFLAQAQQELALHCKSEMQWSKWTIY